MKTKLLLVVIASMFAVGAHAGDLTVVNDSTDAVAIGSSNGSSYSTGLLSGSGGSIGIRGEAVAGSVLLDNACPCLRNIKSINNTSDGAIAVGSAIAGSVVVRGPGGSDPT